MQRRTFLAGSAVALTAATTLKAEPPEAVTSFPETAPRFKKAVKLSMVGGNGTLTEKFQTAKAAGFDGIEVDGGTRDVPALLTARDEVGLPIHGVVYGKSWNDRFSAADATIRARAVAGLEQALQDCEQLGGTSVLVIPGVVDDATAYADAYARAELEIAKALPVAEKTGVDILFENVWNNFLLSPLEFARFIDSFESPSVGAYFDIGNVVRLGWPEQWITALGDRIRKLDVKEYSRKLQQEEGLWKGFGVEIGEGSVDWAKVRAALAAIGYRGWATAEVRGGDLERLSDVAERMDSVLGLEEA
ncbi:sugar phosphate isomerase/epimerase family protein [Alienimonas chondri]|uniref:Xylose isomerase-like TIM barrel domain-containing protein n=1 Tax=Alienimonas chondri TaxID=2681879 RepID=A0ABX1VI35_9PLAN|nr:sugar phosphate isomerase/epimerase family protein [Alienimonas chondri]NNJ26461.1 hypothetical protein [Alienimonas chondri]